MAVKLNRKGLAHALELVRQGKVDMSSPWSFGSDDRNALLGAVDGDWGEYGLWFLGVDTEAAEDTFAHWKYPFGKNGLVYRRGVIAAKTRAAQQGERDIRDAADRILAEIDKEEEKAVWMYGVAEKGIVAVASDSTLDREGESLKPERFSLGNYLKNPVVLWAHRYNEPPIGVAKNVRVEGGKLLFEPEFHELTPFAAQVKQMYEGGILRAFSVGFLRSQAEHGEVYELLEISAVPVPMNPNALVVSGGENRGVDPEALSSVWAAIRDLAAEVAQVKAAGGHERVGTDAGADVAEIIKLLKEALHA